MAGDQAHELPYPYDPPHHFSCFQTLVSLLALPLSLLPLFGHSQTLQATSGTFPFLLGGPLAIAARTSPCI